MAKARRYAAARENEVWNSASIEMCELLGQAHASAPRITSCRRPYNPDTTPKVSCFVDHGP